jgi:hypothetical protein
MTPTALAGGPESCERERPSAYPSSVSPHDRRSLIVFNMRINIVERNRRRKKEWKSVLKISKNVRLLPPRADERPARAS